ncbi:unnamed protein product [Effrenium voratum]|uniref:Calpain catalytic domain-containing protein n=1 Tax=Effrenium voratum TaxID=2562239 RepID=A0AA36J155_9DINO|nr:unnamed protein product [Effrenium voratum]CAJ1424710.1 unnamed protein product [Effrenium voratum]
MGEELWVLLLEKAMAKFCGTYAMLSGGSAAWAFQVMTGREDVVSFNKKPKGWLKRFISRARQVKANARNPRNHPWSYHNKEPFLAAELFAWLKVAAQSVLSCSIRTPNAKTERGDQEGPLQEARLRLAAGVGGKDGRRYASEAGSVEEPVGQIRVDGRLG